MKGTSVKVALVLGLFLAAGLGFWGNRGAGELDRHMPRIVRDLANAIADGDEKAVAVILEDRPDLISQSIGEETLLHFAARHNQPTIIACLLRHGADRNVRGVWNETPLHWACWWGAKAAAEELIAEGFPVNDRNDSYGSTPLLWAAQASSRPGSGAGKGDFAGTVRVLIAHGASVNTCDARGVTALSVASKEVAKILMENGASPETHPSTRPSNSALAV